MSVDNNHVNSEKDQTTYCWVTFTDNTQQKIATVHYADKPHDSLAIRLPVFDSRAQEFVRHRVAKLRICDLDQLNRLAYHFDTSFQKHVYRGQGNYNWPLETKLERNAPESVKKESGLETFELRTYVEAQRRLHHYVDTLPADDDFLSWFALIRHHGVPTRLLDVTKSLFIACYFAMKDTRPDHDAALWVFQRFLYDSAFFDWCRLHKNSVLRSSPYTNAQYGETYYYPFPKNLSQPRRTITYDSLRQEPDSTLLNLTAVLEAAMYGLIDKPGVAIAEPYWLTTRMDVQQGAFLIPFNVRQSFQENLFSYLSLDTNQDLCYGTDEIEFPEDDNALRSILAFVPVIKVRLCSNMHEILKVRLNTMNIRDLTLFPDIEGAMQHISSHVPVERK